MYQARGRVGGMEVWTARLPVSFSFCYCDKHHDPKQLVKERVGFILHLPCGNEVEAGAPAERELEVEPLRNDVCWLVPRLTYSSGPPA